jgi:hypothetical protein
VNEPPVACVGGLLVARMRSADQQLQSPVLRDKLSHSVEARTTELDPTETLAAKIAVMHNARGAGGGREGSSSGVAA